MWYIIALLFIIAITNKEDSDMRSELTDEWLRDSDKHNNK
jgi:hypothetical protein